jgi:hypothetical protein
LPNLLAEDRFENPRPKCALCSRDMTLTRHIDLSNVFKKVRKLIMNQVEEEKKEGSAARVRQNIMEKLEYGNDSDTSPQENLMNLGQEDKNWAARLVKKAGGLYRNEQEQVD